MPFQAYRESRNFQGIFRAYNGTAEIHSMSMKFLDLSVDEFIFQRDMDKFKFSHINSAVNFLPYGVIVDTFQHWIYENPSASPE